MRVLLAILLLPLATGSRHLDHHEEKPDIPLPIVNPVRQRKAETTTTTTTTDQYSAEELCFVDFEYRMKRKILELQQVNDNLTLEVEYLRKSTKTNREQIGNVRKLMSEPSRRRFKDVESKSSRNSTLVAKSQPIPYRVEEILEVTNGQFNTSCNGSIDGIDRIWPETLSTPIVVVCRRNATQIADLPSNIFWTRPWNEVEFGFANFAKSQSTHWIGLHTLHQLTTHYSYSILLYVCKRDWPEYTLKSCKIGSKNENYQLEWKELIRGNNCDFSRVQIDKCLESHRVEWWHCLALSSIKVEIKPE